MGNFLLHFAHVRELVPVGRDLFLQFVYENVYYATSDTLITSVCCRMIFVHAYSSLIIFVTNHQWD